MPVALAHCQRSLDLEGAVASERSPPIGSRLRDSIPHLLSSLSLDEEPECYGFLAK
jgi:hypothetical protein